MITESRTIIRCLVVCCTGATPLDAQVGEKIFGEGTVISERLRIERATPEELSTLIATSYTPETQASQVDSAAACTRF